MKLSTQTVELEQSDNLVQSRMTIAMTPAAMELLSNKIYSDPIMAFIREYLCNAVDATNMVNVKRAIDVIVPNNLSPTWSVRDYGPGMSQDQIMGTAENGYQGLFNTYFGSSKTGTNKQIGGFGLGCKTGYAYVKKDGAFTITSWNGGRKKIYACHRDASGFPAITLMHDADTDEPSGFKVEVPVLYDDIRSVTDKTLEVLTYLDVEFNLTGTHHTVNKPKYSSLKPSYGVVEGSYEHIKIIVGGIAYPIDTNQLKGRAADVCSYARGIHIFAPIGSVELSVSREALSYEKSTIDFLDKVMNDMATDLVVTLEQDIASQPDLRQASLCYNRTISNNRLYQTLLKSTDTRYKGRKLLYTNYSTLYGSGQYAYNRTITAPKRLTEQSKTTPTGTGFVTSPQEIPSNVFYVDTFTETLNLRKERKWKYEKRVSLDNTYIFVYLDDTTKVQQRHATLRETYAGPKEQIVFLRNVLTWGECVRILVQSGKHNKLIRMSQVIPKVLPKAASTPKVKTSIRSVYEFKYKPHYSDGEYRMPAIGVDLADINAVRFYMPVLAHKVRRSFDNDARVDHIYVKALLNALGLKESDLFLIPHMYQKSVEQNKTFVNLIDRAVDKVSSVTYEAATFYKGEHSFGDTEFITWLHSNNAKVLNSPTFKKLYDAAAHNKALQGEYYSKAAEVVRALSRTAYTPMYNRTGTKQYDNFCGDLKGKLLAAYPIFKNLVSDDYETYSKKLIDNIVAVVLHS